MGENYHFPKQPKIKVLFIDDNPLDLQIILNQLSDQFEVTFATNGREALFYATQLPMPDILLVDIHMPNMNGFELCEKFVSMPETAHIPIMFITANNSIRTKTRAFNSGCVDYIVKPIDPSELSLRIHNHVKLARQSRTIQSLASLQPETNICNYHKYLEELATEWNICKRYDYPLSLLHCEIDDFEEQTVALAEEYKIKVIQAVANSVRDIGNRPGDIVAHIDRARFAILLSDAHISHAVNCAKELVARISALKIQVRPKSRPIQVTLSIGVASMFPEGSTQMMAIHHSAHEALEEAKQSGGDDWRMYSVSQVVTHQ